MTKCKMQNVYVSGIHSILVFGEAVIYKDRVLIIEHSPCYQMGRLCTPIFETEGQSFYSINDCAIEDGCFEDNYNYAIVEVNGKFGLANVYSGEFFIRPVYEELSEYCNGYALVKYNGKYGYLNMAGEQTIDFIYDEASFYNVENSFLVKRNGFWGAIDINGNKKLFFEWDCACFGSKFFCVEKDKKWHVYSLDGQRICVNLSHCPNYYLLQCGRKFGVLCGDGRAITDVTMRKKEAIALIKILDDRIFINTVNT